MTSIDDSRLNHPSNRYPQVAVSCDECGTPLGAVPPDQAFDYILCGVCEDLAGWEDDAYDGDISDWQLAKGLLMCAGIVVVLWFIVTVAASR